MFSESSCLLALFLRTLCPFAHNPIVIIFIPFLHLL